MPPTSQPAAPPRLDVRRRRRARAAVDLVRRSLASTRAARVGFVGAIITAGLFGLIAVVLRVGDGASAPLEGLVERAASTIAWIAAAPTALAAASNRLAHDRESGLEALAATRGVHGRGLEAARGIAATLQISRAVGVPLVALALLTAALAGSVSAAATRLGLALGLGLFAIIAGVTLGSVATIAGRIGRQRGRLLFSAVVIVPWILADLAGSAVYSIPGALGAALSFSLELGGAGG